MSRLTCIYCLLISIGLAASLDSLYQLAQPGEGYDKLLTLDSFQVYDGGILVQSGIKSCIRGYGAIIDLSSGSLPQIVVTGASTELDVERCVIINGGDSLAALDYIDSASGILDHLTILDNFDGVRFWFGENMNIKNSIIVSNANYGVVTNDSSLNFFSIYYNDCWSNTAGNYMCWFGSC